MKDGILAGTGNSRFLKSVGDFKDRYPSYESFSNALVDGNLPIDLNGINPDGWEQTGTPLNKRTLLSEEVVELLGLSGEPTVSDALKKLAMPKGELRVELGSYVGNGKTDKVAISSTLRIACIVLSRGATADMSPDSVTSAVTLVRDAPAFFVTTISSTGAATRKRNSLTWGDSEVSWSPATSGANDMTMFNRSGETYRYVIIGGNYEAIEPDDPSKEVVDSTARAEIEELDIRVSAIETAKGGEDSIARAGVEELRDTKQDRVLDTGGWESPLEEYGKTRYFINQSTNKLNNTTVSVSVLYEVEPATTYRITKGESSRFRVGECSDNIASSAPGNFLGDFDGENEAIVTTTDFRFLIIQVTTSTEKLFPEMSVQKYGEGGYEQGGIYAFEAGADDLKRIDTMFQPAGVFQPYFTAADDVDCVMDYAGVIALYDGLLEAHPDFMSKRTISDAFAGADDIPIVEYRLSTGNWNARTGNRAADGETQKPVLLLSSGTHGGEKAAVMGLYCAVKALVSGEFCLREIREKYEIRVIPVVCPYSYNRDVQWNGDSVLSVRTNRNGVNINRNFPVDWRFSNTYPHNFSGDTAGSEYETRTMMAWFTEFSGAVYVDVHNSGYYSEVSYFAPNHNVPADVKAALKEGFRDGVSDILPRLRDERGLDGSNVILAYTGETSTGGTTTAGASSCGCKAALLELSEKVPGESRMTTPVSIGVNAEVIANVLNGICGVPDEHINSLIDNKIGIIDSALQGMIDKAQEGLDNG